MKSYRSDVSESVHKGVSRLHDLGIVDDATMRRFDESCLVPVAGFTPEAVKALRAKEKASQAVLARHLNVATSTSRSGNAGKENPRARR